MPVPPARGAGSITRTGRTRRIDIQAGTHRPVVLFDGDCRLCSGLARFIAARDRAGALHLVPFQSQEARRWLPMGSEPADRGNDQRGLKSAGARGGGHTFGTLLVVDNGRLYDRSSAALQVARHLGGLWKLAYALIIVPKPIRDAAYAFIARRRYRWSKRLGAR